MSLLLIQASAQDLVAHEDSNSYRRSFAAIDLLGPALMFTDTQHGTNVRVTLGRHLTESRAVTVSYKFREHEGIGTTGSSSYSKQVRYHLFDIGHQWVLGYSGVRPLLALEAVFGFGRKVTDYTYVSSPGQPSTTLQSESNEPISGLRVVLGLDIRIMERLNLVPRLAIGYYDNRTFFNDADVEGPRWSTPLEGQALNAMLQYHF